MEKRVSVAWECWTCGHRHLWWWPEDEIDPAEISMLCDMCNDETEGEIDRIGERAYALVWPE